MIDKGSLIKIVWGVAVVAIFVMRNLKQKSQPQAPQDMMDGESSDDAERPMDLETIFREELKRHARMRGEAIDMADEASRGMADDAEIEDVVEPAMSKNIERKRVVTPQPVQKVETRQVATPALESKVKRSKIAREFDLRRAVIESEILTPKFKN